MRKILAALAAVVAIATIGIVTATPANAYYYSKGGYLYADTSYTPNYPGSYVKFTARFDAAQQMVYIKATGYDTVCDNKRAALRIRGWDRPTNKWVYYKTAYVPNACKGTAVGTFGISVKVADSVILSDGIYGEGYSSKSVLVFRR